MEPDPAPRRPARPGFSAGVRALFQGFRVLSREPELWPWALVPALVLLVLEAIFVTLAITVARPWVLAHLPASSGLWNFGADVAATLAVVAVAGVGWLVAVALTPPLSAPALERIVERVERSRGLRKREPLGFFREMMCGFRAMTGAALVGLPLFAALLVLESLLPPLAVLTVPLRFLLSSLLVAWGLFDYPLTLRGTGFRARLSLVRRNPLGFIGFGLTFALVFWLPCCGVVLLPVGVAAATLLLAEIEDPPSRA